MPPVAARAAASATAGCEAGSPERQHQRRGDIGNLPCSEGGAVVLGGLSRPLRHGSVVAGGEGGRLGTRQKVPSREGCL